MEVQNAWQLPRAQDGKRAQRSADERVGETRHQTDREARLHAYGQAEGDTECDTSGDGDYRSDDSPRYRLM